MKNKPRMPTLSWNYVMNIEFSHLQPNETVKVAFSWKGSQNGYFFQFFVHFSSKSLSRKSYLYCFIGLQMTKFKKIWHNFIKKWAFLACFSFIFPLNKEKKWRKNRKSRSFREKAIFTKVFLFSMDFGQSVKKAKLYDAFKMMMKSNYADL